MQERQGIAFEGYHASLSQFDHERLNALAKSYITCLQHYADAPNIIEKLPWNFLYIGLIKELYPDAKIVHIKRNALDTCMSIYRCWFTTPHPYMYDLKELGEYYRLYEDLMGFWHERYPGFVHDIQYEELVQNPESEIKKVLKYCDLPWDPECLEFHKSSRPVLTASSQQVKQPIYSSAIQGWKHYEPYVNDLIEALSKP